MARKRTTSKKRNYVDIYGDYHKGYTHKTKSGRHQINLAQELHEVFNEYANELLAQKEIALDKASNFLVDKFEEASPVGETGKFKDSWERTYKYNGVRYIGNTDVGGKNEYGYDIPLSNLIEFSKNGKPFMRATFERNKDKIIDIIVDEMEKTST